MEKLTNRVTVGEVRPIGEKTIWKRTGDIMQVPLRKKLILVANRMGRERAWSRSEIKEAQSRSLEKIKFWI